jgi:hypothetical protein
MYSLFPVPLSPLTSPHDVRAGQQAVLESNTRPLPRPPIQLNPRLPIIRQIHRGLPHLGDDVIGGEGGLCGGQGERQLLLIPKYSITDAG